MTREAFEQDFARLQQLSQPAWLQQRRQQAFADFSSLGLPVPRQENWKYTDLRALNRHAFHIAENASPVSEALLQQASIDALDCYRLVFVNGHYAADASTPPAGEGVAVMPLEQALAATDNDSIESHLDATIDDATSSFVQLNSALSTHGVVVKVAAGQSLDKPLHLIFLSQPDEQASASHLRVLVEAGEQSSGVVLESHTGADGQPYLTNAITELRLAPGANIEHYRLQQEGDKAYHINNLYALLGKDSKLTAHACNLGARLNRNDVRVQLSEPGAEARLNGLTLGHERQHIDDHTCIDHQAAHTVSEENYKSILDGFSRGVFNGKVIVRRDSQRIESSQSSRNLLMSDKAEMDTKPELEIYADDVKCAHGATIGQLDENQLFYLRSRGVAEDIARSLLTYAFADDIIMRMGLAEVRAYLEQRIVGRLPTDLNAEEL